MSLSNMRKAVPAIAVLLLVLLVAGCAPGSGSGSAEPDYADDEVIGALAHGLESRFTLADEQAKAGAEINAEYYASVVQAELDVMKPYKDRLFEDSKLQESTISYINLLEDAIDLTETYPTDSMEFIDGWQKIYDERTTLLKHFVDDYDLKVKGEFEGTFNELLLNANAVEERTETEDALNDLVASIEFEKEVDDFGYVTYVATAENTSGIDLENVGLLLSLYDEDGVRVEETYANASSWANGESVRFEAFTDVDVDDIKVSLDYYTIADE